MALSTHTHTHTHTHTETNIHVSLRKMFKDKYQQRTQAYYYLIKTFFMAFDKR